MHQSAKSKHSETKKVEDKFYILAGAQRVDDRRRVLKDNETFAIFDRHGDIQATAPGEHGLYHQGTRFLSRFVLTLGGERPSLLGSTLDSDNAMMAADLTNPDWYSENTLILPRGSLHLFRSKFLWNGVCYEQLRFRNYGSQQIHLRFDFQYEADFADIFEVRGTKRLARGVYLDDEVGSNWATLRYRGLDGVLRETVLSAVPDPQAINGRSAQFELYLAPQAEAKCELAIACRLEDQKQVFTSSSDAARTAAQSMERKKAQMSIVRTSNQQFNAWLQRSYIDLEMMLTETPYGYYPYAGVPWFSAAFGRDGIITAMQSLWLAPAIGRSVLSYLSKLQATEEDHNRDAEPGKILHERRFGEMARLGEVPFGQYYGSVDSTPLFVMLAGMYYERTGDRDFIESIWPNIELALRWIELYGDSDQDGFVEYDRQSANGLVNQGWKDSYDSIFHSDGRLADGPIALCEVQAYTYAAQLYGSHLASLLGQSDTSTKLKVRARELREKFLKTFWCDAVGVYALALDGGKKACAVRSSNAGHALFTGIASSDHARRIAGTLMSPEMFSGWGIRTVASCEKQYNPMSYHNGSVWPHDNSLVAAGFARYDLKEDALKILEGLTDASVYMDLQRMPELFCGFHRRKGQGPTEYPVACSPQAWAAGSVFLLLQACLGLQIKGRESQVIFHHPRLPACLTEVQIKELRVGDAAVDIELTRRGTDVGIHLQQRTGDIHLVAIK